MRGDNGERFVPLSRVSFNIPWWQRLPRPVEKAGLRVWSSLPHFVRAPLVLIGRLFYPHTTSGSRMPEPETVPGVEDLIRQGFEPLGNFTGADEDYGPLWPVEHRRESAWPDEHDGWPPPSYPRWFVRSPWPGLCVQQVTDALWMHVPTDYNSMYNPPVRDAIVAEFFRLDRGQVERLWLSYNSDE